MLERGGNAMDAIIAADAALGVVEPVFGGIGGDLFALVYRAKTNQIYGLNASGWTPAGQTIEFEKNKGASTPLRGADAVNVPGAVSGWNELRRRFGKPRLRSRWPPRFTWPRKASPSRNRSQSSLRPKRSPFAMCLAMPALTCRVDAPRP